ncbi:MAG: type II secretion system protein GspG [Verrucomicrobiota bacterium]
MMNKTLSTLVLLVGAASWLLADDSALPNTEAESELAAAVGRYEVSEAGNFQIVVDTATGRVWQVTRQATGIVLTPVRYQHEEGVETIFPEYSPPKVIEEVDEVDPAKEAERVAKAKEFVNTKINDPIMAYASSLGEFPPSLPALTVNLTRRRDWQGPYLRIAPIDPWGNPYRYKYPGAKNPEAYDVWSLGPDAVVSEDDIGNW